MAYDLTKHEFPNVRGLDLVFPTFKTDPDLLKAAVEGGFTDGDNKWHKAVATLFYKGGRVNLRKDIDLVFRDKAYLYFRAFLGSFEPKHEEKMAICAYLLSEIADGIGEVSQPAH